ncbi:MAG: sulfite exporter TauE/SafE family protein, partial [Egibacteraceae bacterium]
GVISGIMATTAGVGGAPVALLYAGRRGPHLRATLSGVLLFGNVLSLCAVAAAGRLTNTDLVLAGGLLIPLTAGLGLSGRLLPLVDAGPLRMLVLLVSFAGGAFVIVQSLQGGVLG